MSAKRAIVLLAFCALFAAIPGNSSAEGEPGKETTELSAKVNTEHLSGINLWIAGLYNEDRTMYAVIVTLVMAALGTTLAFLTDLVLKALGLEVSRISHRE
ncbi:MAG: hypothetical protein M1378_01480 [Bacteroidetes bacterium]|nr:hypothetical protein [Bacteroidota bacterium]